MTRIHAIDLLKLVIATAVVWAHAVLLGGHIDVPNYVFGQGLVRTAVPGFALISGFLFFATHRRGNTGRWLMTLGCAYLFWSLVYLPIWLPGHVSLWQLIGLLILGPIHLWYMAALVVAIAMLAGLLALIPDRARAHRWLLGSAVALLIFGNSLQAIDFFTGLDLPLNAYRNGILLEYPYAAFGYLLAARLQTQGLDSLPRARTLWLITGALAVLRLGEATLSLQYFGLSFAAPPEFLPLAVGFIVSFFLSVLRTPFPEFAPGIGQKLGLVSMFIYFLHYLLILIGLHLGLNNLWLLVPMGTLIPAALALLLARLLREPALPRLMARLRLTRPRR